MDNGLLAVSYTHLISSGICVICEKTENREFLKRLRTIN